MANAHIPYGQPTGWAAIAENIRKYDEDKVRDSKEDIDTLMTFVSFDIDHLRIT